VVDPQMITILPAAGFTTDCRSGQQSVTFRNLHISRQAHDWHFTTISLIQ